MYPEFLKGEIPGFSIEVTSADAQTVKWGVGLLDISCCWEPENEVAISSTLSQGYQID